jgi:hypothetical protein
MGVQVDAGSELLEVASADRQLGLVAGAAKGGQEDGDEQRHDRDGDEQLNEGKPPKLVDCGLRIAGSRCHGETPAKYYNGAG